MLRDSPAEQHLLLLPPTLPQNPSQETWQVRALPLEKSRQDRVIRACWSSSRHEPTRLLERCQPSPRCQSPLNAFLGNTLCFPSPLLIPTSVHEAWAALGFTHWKKISEWDGARRGAGLPLLPCLQIAAAPPWKRCQLRELASSCPSHKYLWISANPLGLQVSVPPGCQGPQLPVPAHAG